MARHGSSWVYFISADGDGPLTVTARHVPSGTQCESRLPDIEEAIDSAHLGVLRRINSN